ncbi:Putative amidase domain-containing protein [Caloramator quimbayensis]|uniref:Putative amidase domain-containing protein n=1 Tax=Caloramator quimbayensis TaxID=1147123 RepID=A0A1T4WFW0_9CLOT|nr:amidase domain-containing protein [Caloramator quimbayensis]SKA76180.1 Putative amidase domain-containing protein [Caloramator quimbayensis]
MVSFRKIHYFIILTVLAVVLLFIYVFLPDAFVISNPYSKDEIAKEIEKIYNIRNVALVTKNMRNLSGLFDTSEKYGQWAMEHEVRRVKYLKDWSDERGIKFTNVQSMVRVKKMYEVKNKIKVSLEESIRFDYIYVRDENPAVNSFGVGLRHYLSLVKKDEGYYIYSDYYTDCFEDAMQRYSGDIKDTEDTENYDDFEDIFTSNVITEKVSYNRQRAVAYADKYCGAAWGSGNGFKYNKKYSDYNGLGGDCTNFISQVLSDEEGGGLLEDSIWFCSGSKGGKCSGSRAWVNAASFKEYILSSGKGKLIKKGTYKELTKPVEGYEGGFVSKLQLGDLICYEKKGKADHFAVVTSYDSHGYPLVNSHTADRYHVPWDLGWGDKGIKFLLIHING